MRSSRCGTRPVFCRPAPFQTNPTGRIDRLGLRSQPFAPHYIPKTALGKARKAGDYFFSKIIVKNTFINYNCTIERFLGTICIFSNWFRG
jgi:hypothetical protein